MKVEENLKFCKLFDIYGKLLSSGQKEIMSYYLNDDLTISEIAENLKVSRQAVMDSITKAEKKLNLLENKLTLLARIEGYEKTIEDLQKQLLKEHKED